MQHFIVFTDMYNSLYNQVTEKMNSDSTWHIRFNLTKQIVNNGELNFKLYYYSLSTEN